MATIGERIKELRKEKGLTQEKLAEILHTTSATVARWEQGVQEPRQDENRQPISDMAVLFHVPIEYLLGETDSREWPDGRLSDEETAKAVLEEERETRRYIINHMIKQYGALSEEMQEFVRLTINNAYQYDEERGKLRK